MSANVFSSLFFSCFVVVAVAIYIHINMLFYYIIFGVILVFNSDGV